MWSDLGRLAAIAQILQIRSFLDVNAIWGPVGDVALGARLLGFAHGAVI
jgi:hypothetical protein